MSDFSRHDDITTILRETKKIAVIGLSDKKHRPSYGVAKYLQSQGYQIFPVNPNFEMILGEVCYASLLDITERIHLVNVFRKPRHVIDHVKEALQVGVPFLWLQEGVIHESAALKARNAGLRVVMDRCILKEHRKIK